MKLNFTVTGSARGDKHPLLRTAIVLRELAARLIYMGGKYSLNQLSNELPLEIPVNVPGATLLVKIEKGDNGN